jgi:hypothetical protein
VLNSAAMKRYKLWLPFLLFFPLLPALAKDQPSQTMVWPETGTPVLRFTVGKFKQIGSRGAERTYDIDATAENLLGKLIPNANFFLYLFAKNKVRIGEGWISLTNIAPGETVKFQTTASAAGVPVSVSLETRAPRTVTITVNSVPQGAVFRPDGVEIGMTPKLVQVGVGKHMLEFSKEGFNRGHFPLEIGPNDTSGGSVSYELGTSAHDTVELRDGSVLSGDVESVSAAEVVVRIGGVMQHFNRNQVKRISLVERDVPAQ